MATTSSAKIVRKAPHSRVRVYWEVTAPVLGAVAIGGFLLNLLGQEDLFGRDFLSFDPTHNLVHVLLAALAAYFGYGGDVREGAARNAARIVGPLYLALAVAGFVDGALFGVGPLLNTHLELGENLIHVALGAWGTFVGFVE